MRRLVALSDPNPGRLGYHAGVLAERGFGRVAQFDPGALARAIAEHGIDRVIITSPDATHADTSRRPSTPAPT